MSDINVVWQKRFSIENNRTHTHTLYLLVHTPKEIPNHLFTCPDIAAKSNYNQRVTKLGTLMKEMKTALWITTAVVGTMKHVRSDNNPLL